METTGEGTIERRLELAAPVERVWRALTDPRELEAWFPDEADVEPRAGFEGSVRWDRHGSFALRVEEVDAPHRLVWSWIHEPGSDFHEGTATRVEWTLTPGADGGTILELRESGFTSRERQAENEAGWTQELDHLRAYLEPGSGPGFRANTDLALHVPDLEAAHAFYVEGLGLRLLERTDRHLEVDAGALRLWIQRGEGPAGFVPSFDVADRGGARARLRGIGATPLPAVDGGYLADPFGNALDVIRRD